MKKILAFLFLLSGLSLFAQDLTQAVPVDPNIKIGKLPNGLTYYIKKNTYPKNHVELRLAVNAGSILEADAQQGLAHFMEHMNFNGTKKFPKNELVSFLQSLGIEFGADLNAYTSFNETVYMLPISIEKEGNFEKGMDVIEDWAFNATLDGEEIDNERGVIIEEKIARSGANSRMWNSYLPKIYAGSKYAERLPIGKEEILKNFKHEELRKFHHDWYRPDLMAILVVGDIDVDAVEKDIITRFSSYQNPENAPTRQNFDILPHSKKVFAVESDKEATFTNFNVNYVHKENSAPSVSVNDYRQDLVENLFSQIINNRFEEIANGPNPPFTYAFSSNGESFARNRDEFSSGTMTSPDKLKEAINVVLTENERVKRFGFVQSELDRAKADILARMEKTYNNRDKRESSRLVDEYINNFLTQELIPSIDWEYQAFQNLIPTITLEEVSGLISKFIHDEPAMVVTGPEIVVTESDLENILEEVKKAELKPYEDTSKGLALLSKIPGKGKIKKVYKADENGVVKYELANGAKVAYMKTPHKNDEILFRAFSYGGTSLISDDLYNETKWALRGLPEAGVNGLSLNDMNKLLSGKTVSVNPSIGTYEESISGNSSNKDMETLFQLIHSYFTGLNQDEAAYKSFVEKNRGIYDNIFNNPDYYYYNEWNQFLNQNDPRNGNIMPKKEDWEKTDYHKAYDLYKDRFKNAGDFTFLFVGSIDESQFKEYVEIYLASLNGNKKLKETYKPRLIKNIEGGQTKVFKKGSEDKVMVSLNYTTPTQYNKTEALQLKMLTDILEIKLTEKLREAEGGVYSLGAFSSINKIPSVNANVTLRIPTSIDKYEKMIVMAEEEVEKLKTEGVQDSDIKKVKETLFNNYKEDIQTNKFWLNNLYEAFFFNTSLGEVKNYEAEVAKVNAESLKAIANKYYAVKPNIGILIPEKEVKKETVEKVDMDNVKVTPREVVNKNILAVSGEKDLQTASTKLTGVKKIVAKGKTKVQGMEIPFTQIDEVTKMTMEMNMMGQVMKQVFSAQESYMEMNGQKNPLPKEVGDKFANRKSIFGETTYQDGQITLKEVIKTDSSILNVIEIKDDAGERTEYYDQNTSLKVKTVEGPAVVEYFDYKAFNGILFPTVIKQSGGGQTVETIIDSYEF